MNTKRWIGFIGGAVVIVAIILLALGFNAAPTAKGSTSAAGMGEVQRYGALNSASQKAMPVSSNSYTGMGDLRAAEYRLTAAKLASPNNSYAGMGDVQRYDSQTSTHYKNGR